MKQKKEIYRKLQQKGIAIENACEVGVYMPETSNIIDFIEDGQPCMLVEPDPASIKKIKELFGDKKNVQLYPYAMYDYNGKLSLSQADASTFVSELEASPALINDKYQVDSSKNFEVECKKFSEIDPKNIDLISIDIEGSEWYVLKHMTSRPKVISVETHGKFYVNPYMGKINQWIQDNGYLIWYKDGSDTVFVKNELFEITLSDKLALQLKNLKISLRRAKKVFR
ncbi:FkbM family methyltransferase [Flammeovirgaceae bacterium SG7u.111]|nr:FkbM family methyltransferase [Flammeovirgaceae bacterium SG7u.132]WPO33780.1 FkbM family methyltransferase [Flammeovirgaceae bacterium SG7u.111]